MKLALLSPFPPTRGGIAAFAQRVYEGLRDHGARVEQVPLNGFSDHLRLLATLRRLRPDILRIEYSIAMYGPVLALLHPVLWLIPRLVGCRMTAAFHEPVREMDALGWLGRWHYRSTSRFFERIYVHTRQAKEVLQQRAGVPAEKVLDVPFGTYHFPDREDRGTRLEATYSLGDREVVLFFGFIHVVKGIEDFIRAARQVLDRLADTGRRPLFVVAGAIRRRQGVMRIFERRDEKYLRDLKELQRALHLEDDVRFLGYIEDSLLYSLIQRARVVVVPYTTAEQSSLLNMAIPLGKPTVASDLAGHHELLADVGGLVPVGRPERYAEEICRLLQDPEHYQQIVDAYAEIESRENTRASTALILRDLQQIAGEAPR